MSIEREDRRKILIGFLPYVVDKYLEARRMIDPTSIALGMVDKYNQRIEYEQQELQTAFRYVENLKPEFENGKLSLRIDKRTTLVTMENYLRKRFAAKEAGSTVSLRYPEDTGGSMEYDAVFQLPERSIFLKILPDGLKALDYANSQMENARLVNPSELWLLTVAQEALNIDFDPIFMENKILRGGIRTLELTDVFREVVGKDFDISLLRDGSDDFKLIASKK
ncbi:MAG: hypothetical protein JRN52_06950 [Nitrososphaerota archaeon]|nr:hypothetical protein [Nitrososphaerota archaeon]